ncbi:unnamed protein product [Blepharisma stoltei]|uniref:Uncharacterized protein n=1 Tax=Blepharisma stoltei TaxID=1481888 RepID=A0AAU9K4Z7_9CILI|nr:unnamed protein product [Blepharisma stoltei]
MTILLPNIFQDLSIYSSHFEHAFYIEMGAILNQALEEAFLSYKYRLNLKMESNWAALSPIGSSEMKFENEIQINDIVIIIPSQNNFPTNFQEIKKENIPWILGLINQDKKNEFNILLNTCRESQFKHSKKYIVAIIGNITSLKREFSVLEKLKCYSLKDQILCPQQCDLAEDAIIFKLKEILLNNKYNKSQIKAIASSMNSENKISLIQGPPGTGKTNTVVGILSGLYAANKNIRVLVCAQSNAAVDEIASTVLRKGIFGLDGNTRDDISLLRIGEKRQKHELGVGEEVKTAKEIEVSIHSIKLNVLVEEKLRAEGLSDPTSEIKKLIEKLEKLEKRLEELQKRGEYKAMEEIQNEFIILSDILKKLKIQRSTYFSMKTKFKIEILKSKNVIFCTLSGSGSMAVVQNIDSIDYLIIDEACQSLELSTLIPFQYNPKSVILIGDPKQLPATTFSEISKNNNYDRSFFERMMECNIRPVLLCQQYRMIREISDFTSKTFYNNQIQCPKSIIYRKIPNWIYPVGLLFFNLETSEEMKAENSLSYYNASEANFVINIYAFLRKRTYNTNAHIGIISPYKGQVQHIEELLYYRFGNSWKKKCEVSSVDGFQGREVDLVILSTVRSEKIGFLRDERRMNVAISRAKYGIYAIGNEARLSNNPKWKSLIDYSKELNKYEPCRSFDDLKYIFNKPKYN